MRLIESAYALAKKENGVSEISGKQSNSRIVEYLHSTDLNEELSNSDETAWCSAFVNWCIQQAGGKGTRSAMARSWLNWGQESDGKEGDIVIFKRGTGFQGHVAFVVSKGPLFVNVLGGNQSNKVCIEKYSRINVLGYRTSKDLNSQLSEIKKGDNMDLVQLLNALVAQLAELQAKLVDAEAAASALAQAKYDQGFAAGVASVGGGDKIYSQAELDAKLAEAVAPLNAQIAAMQVQIDAIPDLVKTAVDAKVLEIIADYKASQVDDAAFLAKYDK